VVKAIFGMFATFFSVSAMLILAQAEFLAIAHLMIYIGCIIVVMIFAMMLSSKNILDDHITQKEKKISINPTTIISGLASIGLFLLLASMILNQKVNVSISETKVNTVQNIGTQLLSNYAFPLEIISLLLLVALMAASIITRKENQHE
jgi:NADH-quinone oxidoreductase subunit J